jgi:hypothetical protein
MSTTLAQIQAPLSGPVKDTGKFIQLRAVAPGDYPFLHSWETSSWMARRWRMRGRTVPFGEWVNMIEQLEFQFIVQVADAHSHEGPEMHGILYASGVSETDGIVNIHGSRFREELAPEDVWPTYMTRAGALLIQYLFVNFDFRKIYMEVPEFNQGKFALFGEESGYFEEEARLKQHLKFNGRLWDYIIYSLHRERFMSEDIQGMMAAGLRGEF